MSHETLETLRVSHPEQRAALASALRLEILGLFTSRQELSVSDMAHLMGRKPASLYYHVEILEKAELLRREGSRRKGKRFEALFRPTAMRYELEAETTTADELARTLRLAFRMSERELKSAVESGIGVTEGPSRTVYATRMHLRLSPSMLEKVNAHLTELEALLSRCVAPDNDPSPHDHLQSLTIAFLPLRDRERPTASETPPKRGS